jgi:hypothetical protein
MRQHAEGRELMQSASPRFWKKSKKSVLNKTNSGTMPKSFGFVSKTISKRLPFRF